MDVIIDILSNPLKAFEKIKRNPEFLFPFITFVIFISSTASCVETEKNILKEEIVLKAKGYTQAQINKYKGFMRPVSYFLSFILFIILLSPLHLIGFLFYAYIISLIIKKIKNENYFKTILCLIIYASFTFPLKNFIEYIFALLFKINAELSFSILYPLKNYESFIPLFIKLFLSNISIFSIWTIFLISEGIYFITEVKRKISYSIVSLLFIIDNLIITLPLSFLLHKAIIFKLGTQTGGI